MARRIIKTHFMCVQCTLRKLWLALSEEDAEAAETVFTDNDDAVAHARENVNHRFIISYGEIDE